MNRIQWVFAVCVAFLGVATTEMVIASDPRIVTAAQVNGTWKSDTGTFKVWALGKQRLQVQFLGFYEYQTKDGPMANTGEGSGIAFIDADVAIFKPDTSESDCKITMQFGPEKMSVEQEGGCGFGHNVIADGIYKKVSRAKPVFGE